MKVRKKPVIVDAILYTGNNYLEICEFVNKILTKISIKDAPIIINTLEGEMYASVGDWIIRGVKGEYYPCKPDVFTETYDIVGE